MQHSGMFFKHTGMRRWSRELSACGGNLLDWPSAAQLLVCCRCAGRRSCSMQSSKSYHEPNAADWGPVCCSFTDRCCSKQTSASKGDPTDPLQLSCLCAAARRAAGDTTTFALKLDGLCTADLPAEGAAACRGAGLTESLVLQHDILCAAGGAAGGAAACRVTGLKPKSWSCSLVACVLQVRWQEELLQREKRWQGELQQAEQRAQQERDRTAAQQQEAARLQQDGAAMLQQIDELEVSLLAFNEPPSERCCCLLNMAWFNSHSQPG